MPGEYRVEVIDADPRRVKRLRIMLPAQEQAHALDTGGTEA
jgi:CBS domain containing-hemolysin-like protein